MLFKAYGELPEQWANRPEIPFAHTWLYNAFFDLTTCRSLGFGCVGPIPWTAIKQYADTYDMDLTDFHYLCGVISAMDQEYISIVSEKDKPKK